MGRGRRRQKTPNKRNPPPSNPNLTISGIKCEKWIVRDYAILTTSKGFDIFQGIGGWGRSPRDIKEKRVACDMDPSLQSARKGKRKTSNGKMWPLWNMGLSLFGRDRRGEGYATTWKCMEWVFGDPFGIWTEPVSRNWSHQVMMSLRRKGQEIAFPNNWEPKGRVSRGSHRVYNAIRKRYRFKMVLKKTSLIYMGFASLGNGLLPLDLTRKTRNKKKEYRRETRFNMIAAPPSHRWPLLGIFISKGNIGSINRGI